MSIFQLTEFSGLLNKGVGDFGKKNNELSAMKNVQEDRIGILKRVPGYEKAYNGTVNSSANVNFLHYYYQPSSVTNYLIGGSASGSDYVLKYRTTGAWTALSGASYTSRADAELSAVNYLGKAFIVGYDSVDATFLAPATINGTTYTTSSVTDTDLKQMPQGKYIVRYRDLLYVLNCRVTSDDVNYTNYRSRAYFCADPVNLALPTSGTGTVSGSWQWPKATNFVEFGQDDGDEITGGADCADRLVVFTQNAMWTYDEANKKKIADIGCDSYKSIKVLNGVLYWANRNGIWRWDGGLPQLISGKVQPMFDAINQTTLSSMVGVTSGFEYRLFIGDVTVDGISYTNTWIVFDVRREKFYIRCTFHSAKSACEYIESGKKRIYFGSSTGYVYKKATQIDNINSDDGNEIDYFFVTNDLDFGSPQIVKQSPQICFYTKNASGMKYVIDGTNDGEFSVARGQLTTSQVTPRDIDVKGYRLKFKFYGKDAATPFIFEGFTAEFLALENA